MQPTLFYTHRPAPPLDRFIEQMWYWQGPTPAHAKDRLLPTGSASLVINLAEDEIRAYRGADDDVLHRYSGAVLKGADSRYSVIDTLEQRAVMGVAFHAGGTWPFFEPAADEVQNQNVSMRDVWGSAGDTLRERILAQPTPHARLQLMEAELLAHAIRPLQRRAEVDFALLRLKHSQDCPIAQLSEHVGLSERRFTRLFTVEVGLTPKLYARIRRFQRVMKLMNHPGLNAPAVLDAPVIDWSGLAQRCGYFDQSHLIRDCKSLSGFTPSQLASKRNGDTLHVAI